MDQARWSAINRIFHAALQVDPGERESLIATESNGDLELQAEVNLLLQADEDAGSYLDSPALPAGSLFPSAPLARGDVLCNRFRIVREIAEGGMGHVFEAFDTELAVPVALKLIRPDFAANPEAIARFRQEVRLARSITHPNICRTFDIERELRTLHGQPTELVFLTMEFLSGQTLSDHIQQTGPLPAAEILAIARQIAAALQAAHNLGIIHRDMKPANIMLVPITDSETRVVVTDFGLARLDPVLPANALASFTSNSHPVGTLAYMAPEQLEGADVSPATDLYAFALILFEMITGKRAFPSNNLLSGIAQRLRGTLPLEELLPATTPAAWRHTINACLAPTPSDRPQTAAAVLQMLEDDRRRLIPRLTRYRTHKPIGKRLTYALIAALVIAVALLAITLRLYQSRTDAKVNPGALVYLTPVKNQTGQRSFDNLSELIQAGLSQSMQVNILDQGRVGDILQQMTKSPDTPIDPATAREIAMRAGAVRVIFANVTASGQTYKLNIDIQQPDNTPTRYRDHWSKTFSWQSPTDPNSNTIPPELAASVRNASDWIRHEVGESATDIASLDTPPEDVTSSNWQALSDYSKASKMQTATQRPQAVALLREALTQDPKFALAYALLGDILYTMDQSSEGNDAYRHALELVSQNRLSLRERDRIKGLISHDTHDFQAAAEAYREYTTYYPNDFIGWFRMGRPLLLLNRTQESIDALLTAHKIDPSKSSAPTQLVRGYQLLHDSQSVHFWLEEMHRDYAANDYLFALAPNQFLEGDYAAAEQTMHTLSSANTPFPRDGGFLMLADLYAERGDDQQMLATLNKALDKQQNGRTQLFYRAELYCKLHNVAACIDDLDRAVSLQPGFDAILTASGVLGRALSVAPASEKKFLLAYLTSLPSKLPAQTFGLVSDLVRLVLKGEILLAQDQPDEAVAEFRKAAVLDAPINPKEYLARALVALAKAHRGEPQSEASAREAAALYAAIANDPARVWWFAPSYPPGAYSSSIVALLQLKLLYPDLSADQPALINILSKLRPQSIRPANANPGVASSR